MSKIPSIDAATFGTWNSKGAAIQSPYEDYDLNTPYWKDNSWNTDDTGGLTDLFSYSAQKNPKFKDIGNQEI